MNSPIKPGKKISELPDAPYKELALEAQRRGVTLTKGVISDGVSLTLIGALDMMRELKERIEILEKQVTNVTTTDT